jgi:hypothetical protein
VPQTPIFSDFSSFPGKWTLDRKAPGTKNEGVFPSKQPALLFSVLVFSRNRQRDDPKKSVRIVRWACMVALKCSYNPDPSVNGFKTSPLKD